MLHVAQLPGAIYVMIQYNRPARPLFEFLLSPMPQCTAATFCSLSDFKPNQVWFGNSEPILVFLSKNSTTFNFGNFENIHLLLFQDVNS